MSEQLSGHPSFDYESARIPEGTRLDDGAEVALQMSRLGTPDEGRAFAEVTHAAEVARHPELERRPVYGHEGAIPATRYTLANRHSEMIGSETLVFPARYTDFNKAA